MMFEPVITICSAVALMCADFTQPTVRFDTMQECVAYLPEMATEANVAFTTQLRIPEGSPLAVSGMCYPEGEYKGPPTMEDIKPGVDA